jgi:hypothetical protein
VNENIPSCRLESDRYRLLRRYGYPSILAESQNKQCRLELKRNRLRTKSDNPRILTLTTKLCRTNVLMLLGEQNSQPQALTTDHETWHCIHVFLNAYRKTSTAPCLATSSLSCNEYSWHAWKCNSSQLTMQEFESIMHASFLCLKVVGVSCVSCTDTPTN